MLIEEASPPSDMRRVVVPSVKQAKQVGQVATQPLNPPLVPADQERTMVERNDTTTVATALERTETERALTLMTEAQANVVPTSKDAPISTPMPNPASTTAS